MLYVHHIIFKSSSDILSTRNIHKYLINQSFTQFTNSGQVKWLQYFTYQTLKTWVA